MSDDYYVELRYYVHGADRDVLDQHVDAMMDALLSEPNLTDPDVGVNFDTGAVDVCAGIRAEDHPTALRAALVTIRSAGHRGGAGSALGWDDALDQVSSRVRPAELADL